MINIIPKILKALLLLLSHYNGTIILIVIVIGLFGLAQVINAIAKVIKVWRTC